MKSIIAGEQTETIFKDTRILADNTVEMIEAIHDDKKCQLMTRKLTITVKKSCQLI